MTVPKEFEEDLIMLGYHNDPKPNRIVLEPEPPMIAHFREQISIQNFVTAFFCVLMLGGLMLWVLLQ